MYLLVAKCYWQATAIIPKILLEYSKLFFLSETKPILLMQILQSLQGQFSAFHFLTLFLKVFNLSLSLESLGRMSHIFGPKNEKHLLPCILT